MADLLFDVFLIAGIFNYFYVLCQLLWRFQLLLNFMLLFGTLFIHYVGQLSTISVFHFQHHRRPSCNSLVVCILLQHWHIVRSTLLLIVLPVYSFVSCFDISRKCCLMCFVLVISSGISTIILRVVVSVWLISFDLFIHYERLLLIVLAFYLSLSSLQHLHKFSC